MHTATYPRNVSAKTFAPSFNRGVAVIPRHPRFHQRMNLSMKERQCVASSSQALPIPGMPHAEAQKIASMRKAVQAEATTTGRKILFAVDGTAGAEEGLKWIAKHVARKGELNSIVSAPTGEFPPT